MTLAKHSPVKHANSPCNQNRRHFLALAAASVGACTCSTVASAEISEPVKLTVDPMKQLFRVRLQIDAEGNVEIPDNPLVSRKRVASLPLNSNALFDYEERYRRPRGADADQTVTAVERFYHEAESETELNKGKMTVDLRDSVRSTIVRRDTLPEIVYANDDYLTRDEVELLRSPISSLATEALLPSEAVVTGDRYTIEQESLRSLLNLSSVDASDVKAEVTSIETNDAKIQIRGDLDGSVDGVPTKIRLVGKLTFDRNENVVTWVAMAIHETRDIGRSEPGFDVAATVRMVRKPMERTVGLPAKPIEMDVTAPIPNERLFVGIRSKQVKSSVLMDRRWRMMSDMPGAIVMRMIDTDRSIAQCDLRALSRLKAGQQWTMSAFQDDVRKTLGEQLVELQSSNESVSETGLRVLTLVARGEVQSVPITWVIQHFSDDSGRRILATFTMESDSAKTFGDSAAQFAETLQFVGESLESVAEPSSEIANSSTDSKLK